MKIFQVYDENGGGGGDKQRQQAYSFFYKIKINPFKYPKLTIIISYCNCILFFCVCRCDAVGAHWIQDCPSQGDPAFDRKRIRPPVGIPMTRLARSQEGGLVLPNGQTGTLVANEDAFAREILGLGLTAVNGGDGGVGGVGKSPVEQPVAMLALDNKAANEVGGTENAHGHLQNVSMHPHHHQQPLAGGALGALPMLAGEEEMMGGGATDAAAAPLPAMPGASFFDIYLKSAMLPRGPPQFLEKAFGGADPLSRSEFEAMQDSYRHRYNLPALRRHESSHRSSRRKSRSRSRDRSSRHRSSHRSSRRSRSRSRSGTGRDRSRERSGKHRSGSQRHDDQSAERGSRRSDRDREKSAVSDRDRDRKDRKERDGSRKSSRGRKDEDDDDRDGDRHRHRRSRSAKVDGEEKKEEKKRSSSKKEGSDGDDEENKKKKRCEMSFLVASSFFIKIDRLFFVAGICCCTSTLSDRKDENSFNHRKLKKGRRRLMVCGVFAAVAVAW